jgi:hypothetical protein
MKHEFTVRAGEGQPQHKVTIERVAYEDAPEPLRKKAFYRGYAGFVIDIQGRLRKAIKKGKRGDVLNAAAQIYWDATLAGFKVTEVSVPVVDAAELELNAKQIAGLEAKGAVVINKDWEAKRAAPAPAPEPAKPAKKGK